MKRVTKLIGRKKGPVSVVLAGIHGNEKCGPLALRRLLPRLQIDRGSVWFVLGNPRAIKSNVRYTEANLNRLFKPSNLLTHAEKRSYEYAQMKILKKYLDSSDALLDIHASRTKRSRRFAIAERNASHIVSFLPFETVVSGFDKIQPGGTDNYMNATGKVGICVECGYLGDPKSTSIAIDSVKSFLKARGHILGKAVKRRQENLRVRYMYVSKNDSFTPAKKFRDFDKIKKGQIVGFDGKVTVRAKFGGSILFVGPREGKGQECFLIAQ